MSNKRRVVFACVAALVAAQASAQVVYVDAAAAPGGDGASWGSAFADLQSGLAAARASVTVREVRVAQGVYRPGPAGDRGVSFAIVEGVALRGGYAGGASATPDARDLRGTPTVLSGDLAGDDIAGGGRGVRSENAYHVVTAVGLAHPAVIDGFHVTGGKADGAGPGQTQGGGLYIDQCGANLVVSRCVVRDNEAAAGGGVMVLDTEALVSQCVIVGNRAGNYPGLRSEGYRLPMVPTIEHCTAAFNTSGQFGCAGFSSLALGPNPDPESPIPVIALRMPVHACISNGNASSSFRNYPPQFDGFVTVTDCLGTDASGWVTTGNVTGTALFADPLGPDGVVGTIDDDFRLRPGSLGIDAGGPVGADVADVDGNGSVSEDVPVDVDGSVRVYGTASDIGASEGPVLTVVTTESALTITEGASITFAVKLTRDPGHTVRVSTSVQGVGGTTPVVTPSFVDLETANWEAGVSVTVSWPVDAGVTDDLTDLEFTGPGIASARQGLQQLDVSTPPGVIYVNPLGTQPVDGASWASGYRTIEAALAVAAVQPAIHEVWVREGTYRPPLPVGSTNQTLRTYNLPRGVALLGGFAGTETSPSQRDLAAHRTIVTGDNQSNDGAAFANYSDNCTNLLRCESPDAGTLIDGVEFIRCAEYAVFVSQTSTEDRLSVRNCRFALNRRGALKRGDCTGTSSVTDCLFEDNGAAIYDSGALTLVQRLTTSATDMLTVERCVFRRNGGKAGSAFWVEGRRVTVKDCTVEDNASSGASNITVGACGVVYVQEYPGRTDAAALVEGCVFNRNTSEGWAAGLGVRHNGQALPSHTAATVRGCSFGHNSSTYRVGGMIFMASYATCDTVGCVFEWNSAPQLAAATGGGYRNCVFRHNTATVSAVGVQNAEGCLFEDNTSSTAGGVSDSGTFTRCTFSRNRAPSGGALGNTSTAVSCVFEENAATAGSYGAMYGGTAIDCLFVGNTATGDGGAASLSEAVNCRFAGNSAGGNGGAVVSAVRMVNCLLTGNTAGGSGGAVYDVRTMHGCTVYGNHAASVGGVDAVNLSTSETSARRAVNCIFWNNTADAGTVEEQQLRFATSASTYRDELTSASFDSIGTQWTSANLLQGPLTGGFTPAQIAAALATPTLPQPFVRPYVAATPVGALGPITPLRNPAEKWLSVSAPGTAAMPSALIQMGPDTAPRVFARAEWRVSFAADGQLGDASSAGLYLGSTPMAGSVGGAAGTQTDWTFDVSDIAQPGVLKRETMYIRNDDGFAGVRYRTVIEYFAPPVAWCVVQGLDTHGGDGNTGADPILAAIDGPDGELGTGDDDATPALGSPAIDSGNSRLIATDLNDLDADTDTLERLMTDLAGNPRVSDCPVTNTGVGTPAGLDRGAVEVLPFEALLAPPCAADLGRAGGVYGRDGVLDNNDFIVFIDAFFAFSPVADVGAVGGVAGADGRFDNNDFVVYIDQFFSGCG